MQECRKLEANHPYELIVDALGNQVLHFTFQNIPPFATKLIHIQSDVELRSAPRTRQAGDLNDFLAREDRIESDSPEILQLAKKLKGRNAIDSARNTFNWVSENVRYAGYDAADRGALHALRNKQGDCTEFMSLFVALCRANGIPARGIGGYLCTGDMILKAGDYHNWAEFYGNGTWHLVDPQKRAFRERGEHYVAMRIISRSAATSMGDWNRFRVAGEKLKVSMEP
jgi:transglutaminase-like putative cysteine protease